MTIHPHAIAEDEPLTTSPHVAEQADLSSRGERGEDRLAVDPCPHAGPG